MAYTAARLNAELFQWWICGFRPVHSSVHASSFPHRLGSLFSQYLFGDNWALNKFNQIN